MTVQASTDGEKILVRFPYNRNLVDRVKDIRGRRWDDDGKQWKLPLTMASCYRLREQFGSGLEIMPPLTDWARAELNRQAELEAAREGVSLELPRVRELAPVLWEAMSHRKYQLAGTATMAQAGTYLLGDDPRLGKTLQTLGTLIERGCRAVVVFCPRTATSAVWLTETRHWAPMYRVIVAQGSRKNRDGAMLAYAREEGPKILVCNTEMMRVVPEKCPLVPKVRDCPWEGETDDHKHEKNIAMWPELHRLFFDAIILDESHESVATTKNTMSKSISQVRYGAMRLRRKLGVGKGETVLLLSGTPFRSRTPRAWGSLNFMRPDVFTSFWAFAEDLFKVKEDGYGKTVSDEPLSWDRFNKELRPYYWARTREEVAPDLPPVNFAGIPPKSNPDGLAGVWLPMTDKQLEAYQDIQEMATAQINGGTLTANGVLAEITRMRQFANSYATLKDGEVYPAMPSNKVDWLVEFAHEMVGRGSKIVVASSFTRLVYMTAQVLESEGFPVMTLTGDTTDRERAWVVKNFANPRAEQRIVVINSKAGGMSIPLHAADDMVFLDIPWTSDEFKQTMSRVINLEKDHQITITRLFSEDTVDEWMAGLTEKQRQLMMSAKAEDRADLAMEALK